MGITEQELNSGINIVGLPPKPCLKNKNYFSIKKQTINFLCLKSCLN